MKRGERKRGEEKKKRKKRGKVWKLCVYGIVWINKDLYGII